MLAIKVLLRTRISLDMLAISVMIETKYACHVEKKETKHDCHINFVLVQVCFSKLKIHFLQSTFTSGQIRLAEKMRKRKATGVEHITKWFEQSSTFFEFRPFHQKHAKCNAFNARIDVNYLNRVDFE